VEQRFVILSGAKDLATNHWRCFRWSHRTL